MASSKIKPVTALSKDEIEKFLKENIPQEQTAPQAPQQKKIALGVLSYTGDILLRTAMCLSQAVMQCAGRGWAFSYVVRESDSMVARGRSFLASQFLENPDLKDATDLVMVDGDLTWDGDEFVRLCSHNVDVVAGAYSYKDESGNMPLRWSPDGIEETNGLWKVHAVTPGFFRVTRRALQKVANELPWLEFQDRAAPEGQKNWMFFDNKHRPNGIWDEGYIFCEYWRQCGGTVWLDPDLRLRHHGRKAYGNFTPREWIDKKAKEVDRLQSEHPGVPALKLVDNVMRGQEVDDSYVRLCDEAFGPVVSGQAA